MMKQQLDSNKKEQEILDLWNIINDTQCEYSKDKFIYMLFEGQAKKWPDKVAIICSDQQYTYGELNQKINALAAHLSECGARAGVIIGIVAERSIEMFVGIMGILRSGAAYMPIQPDTPRKRLRYMLTDSDALLLLIQDKFLSDFQAENRTCVNLNVQTLSCQSSPSFFVQNKPDDLAYVIYTSGSTGNPKGVMIRHNSLMNRLEWMNRTYGMSEKDIVLQKTPFTFDVSVWELFLFIFSGACLCFLPPEHEKFPQAIALAVKRFHITVLHFIPSMLHAFTLYVKEAGIAQDLKSLRWVFASGEALLPSHVNNFNQVISSVTSTRLTNFYGPTEATIDVSFYDCPDNCEVTSVPIGKPIQNTRLYILVDGKLAPIGQVGELCIAGDCLASGYLNNPSLTEKYFYTDIMNHGEKMYRSGDLAYLQEDGNIQYCGRCDNQVKIHGQRMELEEIESVMLRCPDITNCAVIAKTTEVFLPILAMFYESKSKIPVETLKSYLQDFLPQYMIPNRYIHIHQLPKTTSGKVDRKALMEQI